MALAACSSVQEAGTAVFGSSPGVEAPMRPVGGGSATGTAKFVDRGDGVVAMVVIANLPPGAYRVAIHRDGNCTSPNAFSAGPAWAPPGSSKPANELLPVIITSSNGDATLTTRVSGLKTDGPNSLQGRSVVVHYGTIVGEAMPGEPNNRVLCGTVGPVRSFFN
jgi:Cu-Zn family superoxide dismutase